MLCAGVFSVGDKTEVYYGFVLLMFGLYALGANLCYSFAYVLEFFFGNEHEDGRWVRIGRPVVFVGGLVLAMGLALIGGRDVALLEFHHESKKKMSNHPAPGSAAIAPGLADERPGRGVPEPGR